MDDCKKDEFLDLVASQCPYATVTTVRKRKAVDESARDAERASTRDPNLLGPQVSRRRLQLAMPDIDTIHDRHSDPVSVFRHASQTDTDAPDAAQAEAILTAPEQPEVNTCQFCLQAPCVVMDGRPRGPPRPNNHSKRLKDYRLFYTLLNAKRLWENPEYLARKEELGCHIDDIREVMPMCVVKDVRSRWPNPANIPYMGHKRS
ncbi:hypothetical protein ACROYT_G013616 [Oculina patagonica]